MELPKRKPMRLPAYDYSGPGAYFVTICTKDRRCILSKITVGALHEAPLRVGESRSLLARSMGFLKMNSSKRAHQKYPQLELWQRSFHEHVIRNERDCREIGEYIEANPARWAEDRYYEK